MMTKEKFLVIVGLLFTALWICMSSPINPFFTALPGTDSGVFLMIGQGMLDGKVLYVDFFDHKGPLIYLINCVGLWLGGTRGVWFIEFLLMCVSVFIAYKIARFFAGRFPALVATFFAFTTLSRVFQGGNFTEEYALPFMFFSLYVFVNWFYADQEPDGWPIGVVGFCLGCILMLRPNMLGFWAGVGCVMLINMLHHREYLKLLRYILYFLLGVFVCVAPFIFYLWINNALTDFVYQFLVFNRAYAMSSLSIMSFLENAFFNLHIIDNGWLPIAVTCWWLFIDAEYKNKRLFSTAYMLSYITNIILISVSRAHYYHYSMILIPYYLPALGYIGEKVYKTLHIRHFSVLAKILLLVTFFIMFNNCFAVNIYKISSIINTDINEFLETINMIRKHASENDLITVFGNDVKIYYYANRNSASKYIYQFPIADISKNIARDYRNDIFDRKPVIIVLTGVNANTKDERSNKILGEKILNSYTQIYSNQQYALLKLKPQNEEF
jgi:hypothetical protein